MLKETLPSSVSLYGDAFLVRVLITSFTMLFLSLCPIKVDQVGGT